MGHRERSTPDTVKAGILVPAILKGEIVLLENLQNRVIAVRNGRRDLIVKKKVLLAIDVVGLKL
jgi:uncharacterized Fe-S cluster-containing radical SAM superfamily enzyme